VLTSAPVGRAGNHSVLGITRKGGKRATVPLAPPTAEGIDQYIVGRVDGPLLATAAGSRLDQGAVWRLLGSITSGAHFGDVPTVGSAPGKDQVVVEPDGV
jgi:hypothetical protein